MRRASDRSDHRRVGIHAAQGIDVRQAKFKRRGFAGANLHRVVRGHFGSALLRIHRAFVTLNQLFVEGVFHVGSAVAIFERSARNSFRFR